MGVLDNLSEELKNAMKAKDSIKLESLRAIKSAVLMAKTSSGAENKINEEESIKILQRLVKQRKDSASIFMEQGRSDLAEPEQAQAEIISSFLPKQLSEVEVDQVVSNIISKIGAQGMKDMGKVMGMVSKKIGGKAEGKLIAKLVKNKLSL
ncbi:MAG: glutamyl-tRNA amidotransferase [Flavobacteriaceae bacterium TMED179]|nr:MAG: glutamyl-tRNA amidotransferase [Flavobacteriaceae bacterium TMED179]|tara:strand:- start:579 stop:1031 length:453 start_codon:yes stop_codon:yes gene_type:complete